VPPATGEQTTASFAYPKDGSVVVTGATTATAGTSIGKNATADATTSLDDVSIFDGEITADSVNARANAATGKDTAGGSFGGTGVTNLQALGRRRDKGRIELGDWGYLTIGAQDEDASAPGGEGFHGSVSGIAVHLNVAHDGLPAGSEIILGYAETQVHTAAPAAPALVPTPTGLLPGDRPQLLPKTTGPLVGVPQLLTPKISGGPYVFPVYGASEPVDTYGTFDPGAGGQYEHGDDLFGKLGQPVLAVANGTVFSVGWNADDGNRLWLRDGQGNEFSYAHLAAFSTDAKDGAKVKAGEVVGFMGDTGDEQGTATHLHFEVHPVGLLFLGSGGAVDPTTYLASWRHLITLPYPVGAGWAPSVPGARITAPVPGAMLVAVSDISSADGLDPGSLLRASRPKRSG
jgi:murein DD-endopeptidase MepM/ murein hydrolase activator NlpD